MEFWYGLYGMQRPRGCPRSFVKMYEELIDHACRAEELGFGSFWVTEHHFWYDGYCPSLLPVLAGLARRTSRIKLGTGAFLLPLHDPLRVAEDAAVVDNLSHGRLMLGIGIGYRPEEFDGLGTEKRTRGERVVEGITVVQKALSEDSFSHHGKHYQYENVHVVPKPLQQPHPPIWFAGGTAIVSAERAGRHGLAYWHGPATTLEMVSACREAYFKGAKAGGVARESLKMAVMRDVCVARTQEEAERYMREDLIPQYEEQLVGFGFILDEAGNPLRKLPREHPFYRRLLDSFVVGTPEKVTRELKKYQALGIDVVMPRIFPAFFRNERILAEMELFATEVMPHF